MNNNFTVNDLRNKINVNIEEAAILLSVSPKTLLRWRDDGEGPPCFRAGKYWFYPVKAIDLWAMEQLVKV
jgi:predicted site-specific integrase-resolvase